MPQKSADRARPVSPDKGRINPIGSPIPTGVKVDAHVPMPEVSPPLDKLTYRGADRTKAGVNSPPNAKMGR